MLRLCTVSYTHLDVYKRQFLLRAIFFSQILIFITQYSDLVLHYPEIFIALHPEMSQFSIVCLLYTSILRYTIPLFLQFLYQHSGSKVTIAYKRFWHMLWQLNIHIAFLITVFNQPFLWKNLSLSLIHIFMEWLMLRRTLPAVWDWMRKMYSWRK